MDEAVVYKDVPAEKGSDLLTRRKAFITELVGVQECLSREKSMHIHPSINQDPLSLSLSLSLSNEQI